MRENRPKTKIRIAMHVMRIAAFLFVFTPPRLNSQTNYSKVNYSSSTRITSITKTCSIEFLFMTFLTSTE